MPKFTTSDGTHIHYTDEGSGTPILCLSGLTRTGRDFDFVAPHLPGTRLIRPDYRGRGQSGWSGADTYTIPIETRDVIELMDHLGLDRAAILGTSRGGLIAMTMAMIARDRLLGVALNDIGPVIETAGMEPIYTYIGRNPSHADFASLLQIWPDVISGFANVPPARQKAEVERLFDETPDGLKINYDPALRDAVLAGRGVALPDLWPCFDAMAGLPLAALRGEVVRPNWTVC